MCAHITTRVTEAEVLLNCLYPMTYSMSCDLNELYSNFKSYLWFLWPALGYRDAVIKCCTRQCDTGELVIICVGFWSSLFM